MAGDPPVQQRGPRYDLFISYAYVDRRIATRLRRRLQWAPWSPTSHSRMRVFHDSSSLAAGPLEERLRSALDSSRNLLLLASPEAAVSTWVNQEVAYWLQVKGSPEHLLVACTDALTWAAGQAPPVSIVPSALASLNARSTFGGTADRPWLSTQLVVDFRFARKNRSGWFDRRWRAPVSVIASAVTGRSVESLRKERQRRQLLTSALSMLLVAALGVSLVVAGSSRRASRVEARHRQALELAAEAERLTLTDPVAAVAKAVAAFRTDGSTAARSALLDQEIARPGLLSYLAPPTRTPLAVNAQAFDPSARRLATVGRDGVLTIWDLATNHATKQIRLSGGNGLDVVWGADGSSIYAATQRAVTRIDPSGAVSPVVVGQTQDLPLGLRALGDGSAVWYSSSRGFVRLSAGAPTAQDVRRTETTLRQVSIRLTGDVAYGRDLSGRAVAVDLRTGRSRIVDGQPWRGYPGHRPAIAVSSDGRSVAYERDGGTLRLLDVTTGKGVAVPSVRSTEIRDLVFSPDGRYLICNFVDRTRFVRLADQQFWDMTEPYRNGEGVAFSADGGSLAVTNVDHSASAVLDARTVLARLDHGLPYATSVDEAMHTVLVVPSGQMDGAVAYTLDQGSSGAARASPVPRLPEAGQSIMSRGALSPGGDRIVGAVLGQEHRLAVWRRTSGRWVVDGQVTVLAQPTAVAFSRDGTDLALGTANGCVYVWTVRLRTVGIPLCGELENEVTEVAFSHDGKRLAVTSIGDSGSTETAAVWDLRRSVVLASVELDDGIVGRATDVVYGRRSGQFVTLSVATLAISRKGWRPAGRLVAADADGRVATRDDDGRLVLWGPAHEVVWSAPDLGFADQVTLPLTDRLLLADAAGRVILLSTIPADMAAVLCHQVGGDRRVADCRPFH